MIMDTISSGIHYVLLWIDSAVYWFASQCYQLFIKLSSTRIFEDSFFANFSNRIYTILGVFMLFYLAYALLTAIVDPEKFVKGDKGVSSIATNLVVSLILLGLLPTIFNYAYRLQNYVLSSNLIGSLILGTPVLDVENADDGNNEAMIRYGDVLSYTVLNTFLNPENINFNIGTTGSSNYTWYDFKADVLENSNYSAMKSMHTAVAKKVPQLDSGGSEGQEVRINYIPVISTAAGIFLIYILLSFTIDLGIRVIKFAFYQLIAPIPVIMRAVPGKKGTFDKWLKQTLSVYFEVFVRVGVMYMAIYFINAIAHSTSLNQFFGEGSGIQGKLAFVLVIMGIFAFAKQVPKLISDLLGIDTGGLKLGIGEKLKAGGAFTGGAMLGAGVTSLVQNGVNSANNIRKNMGKEKGLKAKALAFGSGLLNAPLSMVAGATSGMFNAFNAGKDAKNFGDMKKAAESGVTKSVANRERRGAYVASHNGLVGSFIAHVEDMASSVGQWAGVSASTEGLQKVVSMYDKGVQIKTEIEDLVKKKSTEAKLYAEQVSALNSTVIKREDCSSDQDYQAKLHARAETIDDMKRRRDIAIAKKANEMLQNLDANPEMKAIVNKFESYKRENATAPGISELKNIEAITWDSQWDDISVMDSQTVKDVLNQLKDRNDGLAYFENDSQLKKLKNEATVQLNERIIKEQEKK